MSKKPTENDERKSPPPGEDAAADHGAAETPSSTESDDALEGMAADVVAACDADAGTESAESQLVAARDRALRLQAELDNFRKRAARELNDERRYAALPLMRDLLPVLDNLDRAIEAAEQQHDVGSLLEGVKMVSQQLIAALKKHDCVPIEALNEAFDPHLHEAILQQPSEDHPANTVLMETETGYRLHDRVVRPSKVIVSSVPESPRPE